MKESLFNEATVAGESNFPCYSGKPGRLAHPRLKLWLLVAKTLLSFQLLLSLSSPHRSCPSRSPESSWELKHPQGEHQDTWFGETEELCKHHGEKCQASPGYLSAWCPPTFQNANRGTAACRLTRRKATDSSAPVLDLFSLGKVHSTRVKDA